MKTKKRKSKLLSFVIAMAMMISLMPMTAFAEETQDALIQDLSSWITIVGDQIVITPSDESVEYMVYYTDEAFIEMHNYYKGLPVGCEGEFNWIYEENVAPDSYYVRTGNSSMSFVDDEVYYIATFDRNIKSGAYYAETGVHAFKCETNVPAIKAQPTTDNPTFDLQFGDKATYQWYVNEIKELTITSTVGEDVIKPTTENWIYENGLWKMNPDGYVNSAPFDVTLKKGDTLKLVFSPDEKKANVTSVVYYCIEDLGEYSEYVFVKEVDSSDFNDDGSVSFVVPKDGIYCASLMIEATGNYRDAHPYVQAVVERKPLVEGQTTKTFTGAEGTYVCMANWGNYVLMSNSVTIVKKATFIDSVDVQIDWSKIPVLEEGMTELPEFEEMPGTITVIGAESIGAYWAVKVDESFKITSEDSYYNELVALDDVSTLGIDFYGNGEAFIKWYNGLVDNYITVFSSLAPIEFVLENPYYKINDKDTYSMYVGAYVVDDGYSFGGKTGEEYQGELTSNVDILCQFVDIEGEGIIVFFKLGTIAEIEDAKNEANKDPDDTGKEPSKDPDDTEKEPSKESGDIEKDAEVAKDAPIAEATLDNSKEELLKADKIFTETEKQAIADGADAKVWLEINKVSDIAPADKSKIEDEAAKIMGEDLNITYFDAKLFKQVGNNPKAPISEPGIAIKVTITIPKELLNTDGTINREYMILRLHEGQSKADVIKGTFDAKTGEFTFETDKFSTYAIVYKDTAANVEDPTTGINNGFMYVGFIVLISGLGIAFCASKRKVRNNAI